MLNEWIEYDQYTSVPDSKLPKEWRLNTSKNGLGDNLNGLSRPLMIIARRWLFDDRLFASDVTFERETLVIEVLKAWLGFGHDDLERKLSEFGTKEYEQLKGWLPNYIETKPRLTEAKKDAILKNLENRKKSFSQPLFNEKIGFDTLKNTKNKLTFESVTADALNEGPLKVFVLLSSDDFSKDVFGSVKDKPEYELDEDEKDYVERVISAYALARYKASRLSADNSIDDASYEVIKLIDIRNWCRSFPRMSPYDRWYFINEKLSLLLSKKEIGGNTVKIKVAPDYLKKHHFQLLEKDYLMKSSFSGYVYEDVGSGKYLDRYKMEDGKQCQTTNQKS